MSIQYVEYGGTQMLQPPYNAENVGFYAFLIEADTGALQKLLDDRLNRPSGGAVDFEPAGPFVVLAFNKLEKMSSVNPPDSNKGWFSEQECAVWVRVVDRKTRASRWFHPYIFVDNGYALALGREVYGFPKATGWFDIPEDPKTATAMSVETLTLPVFSPNTQGVRTRLISARQTGASENPVKIVESAAGFGLELLGLLKKLDLADGLELVWNSLKDLFELKEPMVFLKQFPAPDVPGTACFQAIVEMTAQATAFHGAAILPGEWEIDIAQAASHPVASDLGLAGNSVKARAQFWVGFDMIVGLGQNVWTAPTGAATGAVAAAAAAAPRRIAILGGGVGAMTTALELTSAPDWKSRYDVTVYQMGWRLGGKCASGRGECDRIEEHGLHLWLGFYENAFRIIQQVYKENEVNRPAGFPLRTWDEAFKPHDFIALTDRVPDGHGGHWAVWPMKFPKGPGTPGDGKKQNLWDAFLRLLGWVYEVVDSSAIDLGAAHPVAASGFLGDVRRFFSSIEREFGEITLVAQLDMALTIAQGFDPDPRMHSPEHYDGLMRLFNHFLKGIRERLQADVARGDCEARRLLEIVEFAMAVGIGLLEGGYFVNPGMLNKLTGDLQDWLRKRGASPLACEVKQSALLRGFYDLVFAYENGDVSRPSFEAGPALRSILLIAGAAKGSIFWKMQAGMGDVVFAPIYEVLKKRGVKFEFFHAVERLDLNAAGTSVEAIQIGVQATPADAAKGYDPLIVCKDLTCWPASPRYDLLKEGKELKDSGANLESFWTTWQNPATKTLTAGEDFDEVVLGISIGSLPYLFEDVKRLPQGFQEMLENVKTVATQSLQLWVDKPLDELGWKQGDVVLDAFADPMNTWAVMNQLLERENFPDGKVNGIHYFCGPMAGDIPPKTETSAPREAVDAVTANAKAFKANDLPVLWPGAGDVQARVVSEFFKANIDPSDRYVLSLAGSTQYRLRADESGLSNVVFAGDWTDNGFNAGCVEAATMSGIQAANAIKGRPLNEGIDGPLVDQLREGKAAAVSG